MSKEYKVEISYKTVIFTVVFLLGLQIVWMMRELIYSFIIAFIIMSALNPPVTYLEKKRIPRAISALIIFIIGISGLSFLISWIVPPIVIETTGLFKALPSYLSQVNLYGLSIDFNSLTRYVPDLTSNAFQIVRSTVSNIVFVITTLFFSYYFLIEANIIKKLLVKFVRHEDANRVAAIFERAEVRMRDWLWGQLTLMLTIGLLTYIGLLLVGAKYPLPMAVLAGLLEVVPMAGPIISAIPAILINSIYSPIAGFTVAALYFIVQQLENQIIVPVVMRRAVGLNPIITLAALIIGGNVGGIMGMLLSIPVALFIETIIVEYAAQKKEIK